MFRVGLDGVASCVTRWQRKGCVFSHKIWCVFRAPDPLADTTLRQALKLLTNHAVGAAAHAEDEQGRTALNFALNDKTRGSEADDEVIEALATAGPSAALEITRELDLKLQETQKDENQAELDEGRAVMVWHVALFHWGLSI